MDLRLRPKFIEHAHVRICKLIWIA